MPFQIRRVDSDGKVGEEHVGEEKGRGGVNGEVKGIKRLRVEEVGVRRVCKEQVDHGEVSISVPSEAEGQSASSAEEPSAFRDLEAGTLCGTV